jgi:hypothetical protein
MIEQQKGFVYIFSNKAYPGKYKIGKSKENPIIRAKTLSKQTGALGEFKVEWDKEVPEMNIAEQILHYKFSKYHCEKEFFEFEMKEIINEAAKILDNFFNVEYKAERIKMAKTKAIERINELENQDVD